MTPSVEEEYEALIQFLYIAPIGLLQARHDGEIVMVNPLCGQLLMPLSRDGELSNLYTALESVAPDLRHRVQAFTAPHGMVCDALHLQVGRTQATRKDPQILSLSLMKLDSERLMVVLSDVTQSLKRDRELRQSQAWLNALVSGLTDYALVQLDGRGQIQAWNSSIGRVTGFGCDAVEGQSYALFHPPDSMPTERVLDRLHDADSSGWSLEEGWRLRADGSRFWGSCLIAPLHAPEDTDPESRAYSLILRDVSERREATQALWQTVSCDHLTGLANRRAFHEAAELEIKRWQRQPRPLSVLMIDADHFKRINDGHGHAVGDAVLRHLAACLSATFRTMDVVARVGGEEFAVLLPGTGLEGAEAVALRVCERLRSQPVHVDGKAIGCTVSIGVAAMERGVDDVKALLQRADSALYAAKAAGRNRVLRWHTGQSQTAAVAV